jgi:hypothetical protein
LIKYNLTDFKKNGVTQEDAMVGQKNEKKLDSKRVLKMQAEARERVVQRATVQFRTDPEMMDMLLSVAKVKRTPPGALARLWVAERLEQELKSAGLKQGYGK